MTDQLSTQDLAAQLDAIRVQISRIQHDLNNPLAVISGNVELIKALSDALGVAPDVEAPLKDVGTAVEQLEGHVDRLLAVRGLLAELTAQLQDAG